jgi:hypothetical protein
MDFDQKKYTLDRLKDFVYDCIDSEDVTEEDFINCIKEVVDEQYLLFKNKMDKCSNIYQFLEKNNSKINQCNKEDDSSYCKSSWNSFWEEHYYPKEYNDSMNLDEQISRNDSNRIDYKDGYVYESPDGGKTVYKRKIGETTRTLYKL